MYTIPIFPAAAQFRGTFVFTSAIKVVTVKIHVTAILLLILHWCEIIPLKIEHALRVFQNTVLRRIFGPSTEEATGGWRCGRQQCVFPVR
jgi:hypothetical protein